MVINKYDVVRIKCKTKCFNDLAKVKELSMA